MTEITDIRESCGQHALVQVTFNMYMENQMNRFNMCYKYLRDSKQGSTMIGSLVVTSLLVDGTQAS